MKLPIIVDDVLMAEALSVSGIESEEELVAEALKLLISSRKQAAIRRYRGKLHWDGDLDAMRTETE